MCSVTGKTSKAFGAAVVALCLFCADMAAQQQEKSQTDIPDAPSASRPFPNAPPQGQAPRNRPPQDQAPEHGAAPEPGSAHQFQLDRRSGLRARGRPCASLQGNDRAPGGAPAGHTAGSDELFKITVNTNQVVVPVMVKDDSGRLVNGLLSRDFSVFEDGKKQNLNFFTTDPFALSAAVLFDTGMPDVAVQKVIQTFSALQGVLQRVR